MNYKITECYTGGGCDHYEIVMGDYSLFFLINNNDCNIPKEGESWGFCVYDNLESFVDGNTYIDCLGPFENFRKKGLLDFILGYVAAKGYKKDPQYYELGQIDYMELSSDIANSCEPHVLVDSLYFYLKTLKKDELEEYVKNIDSNEKYTITNYLEKTK
jgi:hypothetical protein